MQIKCVVSEVTPLSYLPPCKVTHLAICSCDRNPPETLGNAPANENVRPLKIALKGLSAFFFSILRAVIGLGATFLEGIAVVFNANFLGAISKVFVGRCVSGKLKSDSDIERKSDFIEG